MDDEVGMLLDDPPCERRPIGIEMRLTRTEMRVRDLDEFKSHGTSTLYFEGLCTSAILSAI
jgi:hypothetical protein